MTHKEDGRSVPAWSRPAIGLACQCLRLSGLKGDFFLRRMAALLNRHRLRIMASLAADGRQYVSQCARNVGISRPLHQLQLEEAGLVRSRLELSPVGNALTFYEVCEGDIRIDPAALIDASRTITAEHGDVS